MSREHDTSYLEIYDLDTREATLVQRFDYLIEAPNWSQDGRYLYYNSQGLIHRLDLADNSIETLASGEASRCNNDHVLSPHDDAIAVSSGTEDNPHSRIFIVPFSGAAPRLITERFPSYLHGWSPDGRTLAYCAERDGEYDIYTIPVTGGKETRLTDAPGLNDGPEYSPCGRYIWFNSVRTGLMQAWRMDADGANPTQMTFDQDLNTWFPHVSPDGEYVLTIAYHVGDLEPHEHLPHKHCVMRLMRSDGSELEKLFDVFGGQGTINVNSWAPNSRAFAYVRYEVRDEAT